jgi:hypothetical protein
MLNHTAADVTAKKKKGKPKNLHRIFGFIIAAILICGVITAVLMDWDSELQMNYYLDYRAIAPLNEEQVPTAESLLIHPQSAGTHAGEYQVLSEVNGYILCLDIVGQNDATADFSTVRILLNGQEVRFIISGLYESSCFYQPLVHLQRGFYIVEVQLIDDGQNSVAIYRHAIEIEAD